MAFEKLTDRSELTAADNADLVHVVDVSDTTVDAAGNSKKLTVANLMKSAPVQSADIANFATTTYVDTEVGNEETARITADSDLQIQINGNDTDIASLDTRVTSNENEILSLEGRVTTSEGEIDALQAQTYVESFNTLTGPVTLLGGTDITLSTTNNQITINSTASGGGGGSDSFNTIAVSGQSDVVADSGNDTLTFVAGTNITITTDANFDSVTFNVTGLDTDDVTEGATNLYYTAARVLTQLMATSVTAHNDVTNAGSGAIITAAERTKLNGIEAGAEVNVQSDWNATSGDAFIQNKPTIPPALTDTDDLIEGTTNLYYTDARVSANADVAANTLKNSYPAADATKLAGIEAGAEVNVQSDWNAVSGDALILNKPTIPPALTDTDDLTEGTTNLYYTDTRVQTYLTSQKIRANYPSNEFIGNTLITSQHEQTLMIGKGGASMQFAVSAGLAKDCEILVMQIDAGDITIVGATGVTIVTTSSFYPTTAGQYAIIGLKQIGSTDTYVVTGERKPV